MKIKSRVVDKVGGRYVEVSKDMEKGIREVLSEHLEKIQEDAKVSIFKQSPGPVRTRIDEKGNKRQVTASRAGNAPNYDTGELYKSITAVMDSRQFKGWVYSPLEKARELELHQNRPFLKPAFEKHQKSFFSLLRAEMVIQMMKAGR